VATYLIDRPRNPYYVLFKRGESVGTWPLAFSRSALFLLPGALIALVAVVAVSLQRESASGTGLDHLSVAHEAPAPKLPALTPEEETFAEALWPLHQEVVEASAGRLTSAGMTFAVDDHDANRLVGKLTPLRQIFVDTQGKVEAISAPPSMQPVRERYVALLVLYEQSATEMMEVARDGDEGHLINAQSKSERAAQELVKVGDILWPGEHKPN
jgi:hypothetical protein